MKPLFLQVEAFGPYLDRTTIDFEKLNDAGLFLISGSTGGGKTTLLDAMCMALYNKSTGGRRSFSDMRSLTSDNTQRTEVTFVFSLGEEQYQFHRALYMKKKRGSEIYDLQELHECSRLQDGKWEPQASGSALAVTKYAQNLLSLTAEQFSQVIVLPQGEFLRLLRASSSEKGEILKTLFACEDWKRLVAKLGDRHKSIYAKRQNTEAMLQSLLQQHGATDSAALDRQIETYAAEQTAAQEALTAAQKQASDAQTALELALTYAQLTKEARIAAEQRTTAGQQLAAAEKSAADMSSAEERIQALQKQILQAERQTEALRQENERSREKQSVLNTISVREKQMAQMQADIRSAEEERESTLKSIAAGDAYLAEVTQAAEAIPALLKEKNAVETRIRNAEEHKEAQQAVLAARKLLESKKDEALHQKLAVSAQDKAVAAAEAVRMANSAAALAAELTDGTPCPVCGSVHHPSPAFCTENAVSEDELDAMRAQLEHLRGIYTAAENTVSAVQAKLDIAADCLEKAKAACGDDTAPVSELQNKYASLGDEIAALEKKAALGPAARQKLQRLREKSDAAEQSRRDLSAKFAACSGELDQLYQRAKGFEAVRDVTAIERDISGLQNTIRDLTRQHTSLENARRAASEALAAAKERLSAAESRSAAAETALKDFGDAPSMTADACSAALDAAQKKVSELSVSLGSIAEALGSARHSAASVQKLTLESAELDVQYSRISRLYGLLSGQKNSLRMPILQYVLSMMLEETIYSANRYFTIFSRGRYALRRMTAPKSGSGYSGLDIEVLDGMSGTCRSIETLSGGEQFLASLSLAFGLSEVVQSNAGVVRMDSIFIDEGFGSLDGDTLDTAMKALETIRQSGRVVGIISHVAELRHRIPTMIRVSHKENGSAAASVISE